LKEKNKGFLKLQFLKSQIPKINIYNTLLEFGIYFFGIF